MMFDLSLIVLLCLPSLFAFPISLPNLAVPPLSLPTIFKGSCNQMQARFPSLNNTKYITFAPVKNYSACYTYSLTATFKYGGISGLPNGGPFAGKNASLVAYDMGGMTFVKASGTHQLISSQAGYKGNALSCPRECNVE